MLAPSLYRPTVNVECMMRAGIQGLGNTAMVFPLKQESWKLKLGVRNEYNSTPLPGVDPLDNTYYVNLVYEMK